MEFCQCMALIRFNKEFINTLHILIYFTQLQENYIRTRNKGNAWDTCLSRYFILSLNQHAYIAFLLIFKMKIIKEVLKIEIKFMPSFNLWNYYCFFISYVFAGVYYYLYYYKNYFFIATAGSSNTNILLLLLLILNYFYWN